jgi:antitoxin VapB
LLREAGHGGDCAQVRAEIRRIQERIAELPVLDERAPDEIIGYDEHGLPG